MVELKDLLSRFSGLLQSGESKTESVREIIKKATNLDIKKEDIKIKDGIIYLNIKPIYKSEIYLKKDRIIEEMEILFGKKSPSNIR